MKVVQMIVVKVAVVLMLSCIVCGKYVQEMENSGLFQGDIVLDPDEMHFLKTSNSYGSIKGGRWKNGIVPYQIESSISYYGKRAIMAAIDHYHKHTCLKFVPKKNEWSYISFYRGDGCSSPVGYRWLRKNRISLGTGCAHTGIAIHEIGHSIGLYHEQSRPDRDKHVEILWKNIKDGMDFNFKRQSTWTVNSLGTPYDYDSIMHYDSRAFGNGRITIRTLDKSKQNVIGQRRGLSEIDKKQINLMYNCKTKR